MDYTFSEYQSAAKKTAIYPVIGHKVIYPVLGLTNEAGEVAGKIKKIFRDKNGEFSEEALKDLKKELGDVLWYLTQVSAELGISLEEVAKGNIEKLAIRKELGTIQGSGDEEVTRLANKKIT